MMLCLIHAYYRFLIIFYQNFTQFFLIIYHPSPTVQNHEAMYNYCHEMYASYCASNKFAVRLVLSERSLVRIQSHVEITSE